VLLQERKLFFRLLRQAAEAGQAAQASEAGEWWFHDHHNPACHR
jgi:hypothetical protein